MVAIAQAYSHKIRFNEHLQYLFYIRLLLHLHCEINIYSVMKNLHSYEKTSTSFCEMSVIILMWGLVDARGVCGLDGYDALHSI